MLPGKKYAPMDFVNMAWRRRWLIAAPAILGLYAALIVSSRLQDMYQAEMLIQVVPQRVPEAYVRSTVTMRTEDRLNALYQQVQSRTELERLIDQMNLYPRERAQRPMQDVIERMRADIKLDPVRAQRPTGDTEAFYVRFTYSDPDTATKVTERLGALFIDVNARDRGDLAQATDNFLQTQLAEARRGLEEQEAKLEEFRKKNSGKLPTQLTFNMQAIQNAQSQIQALVESLARDRDRKLMLEQLYTDAQIEPPPAAPPPPAAAPQADPAALVGTTTEQQLAAARRALAAAELRLKPEHPDIVRIKRQIADLESRLGEEKKKAGDDPAPKTPAPPPPTPEQIARRDRLQDMRASIESLDRQIAFKEGEEKRLRDVAADYQRKIEQVPEVESEFTALNRDYDTKAAAYKDMLSKSEQSKVASELEKRQIGEQFRVLDPARPPIRPVGVQRLQVNGIGLLAGLCLGVALAALLEFRDATYQTAADVLDVLKLPVIALVPYVATDADVKRKQRRRVLASSVVAVAVVIGSYGVWAMQLWKHIR